MNLMKYFNLNFLKTNLKKSQAIILLLLTILPLFNIFIFICIISSNNLEYNIIYFSQMSIFTNIEIFIIPISFAFIFYGFILKKKSVDFYLSLPVSRKTIFWTNLIGGLILILAFIGINSLLFILVSIFTSAIIPFSLIFDYFLYWTIAYLFVYIISTLALSLSNNTMTSIVIILLLLFFYPFISMLQNYGESSHKYYYACEDNLCMPSTYECYNDTTCENHRLKNEYAFYINPYINKTLSSPTKFILDSEYSQSSLIKTVILSIIYTGISYYLFLKRKMEHAEGGIKNIYLHFGIKTLTFLPIAFLCFIIINDVGNVWICIAFLIAFIYYLLYDLITQKKIYHFWLSFTIFLITFGITTFSLTFYTKLSEKEIVFNKIDEITLSINNIYKDVKITDQDLINKIIKSNIFREVDSRQERYYFDISFIINGKKFSESLEIPGTLNKEIDNYILENNIPNFLETINYEKENIKSIDSLKMTSELKKLLEESKNKIIPYQSYLDRIIFYKYQNHHFETISYPINATPELSKYITTEFNNEFLKNYDKIITMKQPSNVINISVSNLSEEKVLRYFAIYPDEFKKFLEDHKEDLITGNYMKINSPNRRYQYYFSDSTLLAQEIKKYEK